MQHDAATIKTEAHVGSFYDRIANLYNLMFKVNGYGHSLEQYLAENPIPLDHGARILDAGCGTGLLTLSLLKALKTPVRITALDLSSTSIETASKAVAEVKKGMHRVAFTHANVLALPFADDTFDLVVTSGALEYVPLDQGISELARVLTPNGYLLHLPVRPSPVGRFLELLFRFKSHSPQEVAEHTERHFRVVTNYHFPPHHPIGWSKTALLAQKV
jgi:ubiquinone/menaquinone biosynthesis C-methylase UbiE